ncbi:MAG: uracil-DNA glycosylase [Epsilonproteobacteria bacterium]|nr:uracil-DNA glycosylase [Campylobacterota bacterium]
MYSYENLKVLQNLYRLKALDIEYTDPLEFNSTIENNIDVSDFQTLVNKIKDCHLCDLCKSRTQSLSGFGNEKASVLFVDHVVSEMEDSSNSYFCGRSGEMLQNMILNVLELSLNDIYFTHTIKCKPLDFKKGFEAEWKSCSGYLYSQIEFIKPKVIVTLGEEAFHKITGDKEPLEKVRGHIMEFKGIKLIPIYHPNFILRNPNLKKVVFSDLKTIKSCL